MCAASPRTMNGVNRPNGVHRRAIETAVAAAASPSPSPPLISRHVELTGQEIMFGTEEILVTKTDLQGRITYANDVFIRIAGYTEGETIGQPHSMIRHPDMPRVIFKLLWETIQSGKEIFAYVCNSAANGGHYWVFAHVTPTFDNNGQIIGYHSSRRCPDRQGVEKAKALYEKLRAAERGHARKADAIAASLQVLQLAIAEHHSSYEEFVFSL